MKQINTIQIKEITIQGFKGYLESQTFNISPDCKTYPITLIEGDNGQGKSSILEAITYAFTGCTFWGDNKNERLINNKSNKMQVNVIFRDENSAAHTISRRRSGSVTTIALDGIPVKQADLIEVFGEKDCFLSIVNPLFFIETMADSSGRDFLLRLLPLIRHEDVLYSLNEHHKAIIENENIPDPANYIKIQRAKTRELEDNKSFIEGQLDIHTGKISTMLPSINEIEESIILCRKELEEIEVNEPKPADISILESQKLVSEAELNAINKEKPELLDFSPLEMRLAELKAQSSIIKSRTYSSGVNDLLSEVETELQKLRQEWNRLDSISTSLTANSKCPSCFQAITDEHINNVKVDMQKSKAILKASAEPFIKRREWLISQDDDTRKNFETRLADEISSCESEISRLTQEIEACKTKNKQIIQEFSNKKQEQTSLVNLKIQDILCKMNHLNNNSENVINDYKKRIVGKKEEIIKEIDRLQAAKHMVKESEQSSKEAVRLKGLIQKIEHDILTTNQKIQAAIEYVAKRAELTLKPLKMDRVEIKLQDVTRTTGEIVNTFRFTYDGKDYKLLSLSEKMRAGLEVSNLIMQLTKKNYPVLIDNTESITRIDNFGVNTQTILTRVVPGANICIKHITTNTNLPANQHVSFKIAG